MPTPFDWGQVGTRMQLPEAPPIDPMVQADDPDPMIQADDPGADTNGDIIAWLRSKIRGKAGDEQDVNPVVTGASNAGQVLGSLANDERMNRISRGNMTQNYDQSMLQAQTGRNQNENDALRKMAITSYLKSGGYKGSPTTISLNGKQRTLPSYGSAPQAASKEQMESAGTLEDMLTQRLKTGGSYLPQPLEDYAEPGTVENVGRIGGTIAAGAGTVMDMINTYRNRNK